MPWYEGDRPQTTYEEWLGWFARAGGGAIAAGAYIEQVWAAEQDDPYTDWRGIEKFDSFNVAVAGHVRNEALQSVNWTIGRPDWFSTLTGSSASATFVGDINAEPGDEFVIHTTYDVHFVGWVETITQSTDLVGNITTTVVAQDVVSLLGQTDLASVSFESGSVDDVLSQILALAKLNTTVSVTPTVNALPVLDAITDYTGSALELINRIERSTNTLVFAQPDGSLAVSLRDALEGYGARVTNARYAVAPTRHYAMDEASGNLLPTGFASPSFTPAGSPTYQAEDPWGNAAAIAFDGTDDTFNAGDNIDLGTSYTLMGWAYWPGPKGTDDTIIYKRTTGPNNGWFAYISTTTGRFDFVMQSGGSEITSIPDDAPSCPIDEWFHWAVVEDGSNVYLYVNGSEVARGTTSGNAPNTTGNLYLGSFGGFANWFRGRMCNVSIWQNNALSAEQIKTLVNPALLLDTTNSPSTWITDKNVTTVQNAFELVEEDGTVVLSATRDNSIKRYGLRAYQVTDYLTSDVIPITATFMESVAHPRQVLSEASFPIRGYGSKAYLLKPLDLITRDEQTLQVMSVSHDVNLSEWTVSITADQTAADLEPTILEVEEEPEPPAPPAPPAPPEPPASPDTKTLTLTFDADRDTTIAQTGSGNYGNGGGDYLPVGRYAGITTRALIHFPISWPTGTIRVTKAYLKLKTSDQAWVAFGGNPKMYVRAVKESWSEGSYSTAAPNQYGNNATRWDNQPSTSTIGQKLVSVNDVENNVIQIAITDIAQYWLDHGNNGLRLHSEDEGSTARTIEFHSREGAYDPRLVLTVEVPA